MKKASIKDVANLAGVSIATVSQILNNKGERFSEETRNKVFAAREETGYVPNLSARSLKKNNLTMIGVVVPSLALPYFGYVVQKIQDGLPENVSLSIMSAEGADTDKAVYQLMSAGVNGIIVANQLQDAEGVTADLKKRGIACVMLENHVSLGSADVVAAAEFAGGQLAAQHLLSLGHRHVAVLGKQAMNDNLSDRLAGFKETMLEAGAKVSEVTTHYLSKQGGQASAMAVSISKATATFALNDELAIGLISGLDKIGISVPEKMSVIGYDDTDYARFYQPSLTTVHQPLEEIAKASLELVLSRVQNFEADRQERIFDVKLIERASTRAI
ncbi:LacI family transcriptional regulator [Weissella ceti]|uniref:LacI family transcriptional regulator n=1 Tax=Weissella ceti TaxID=759620 RepID=A0ABT3E5Y5_9LACO|nr:LacI family DNA-binding transcriptional regulator [Weissella ceti]MCW0953828.1 LacI family transcriptional regulator [Weissella ceti]QVK11675.1 LacI family DNA-binding transcriptional regulator [Weissella ceti]